MSYAPNPSRLNVQTPLPSGTELLGSPDPPAGAIRPGRKPRRRQTGPRNKKRCFNCRKWKKKCTRPSPDRRCEVCEHGNYICGPDLTHEQWRSRQENDGTHLPSNSSSSVARALIHRDLRSAPHLRAPQNRTTNRESRSSSEGTDIVETGIPEFLEMFSQNHSRRDPQTWWLLKLGYLLNTMHNFQEIYGTPPSLEGFIDPPAHLLALLYSRNRILEHVEDAVQRLHELAMEASATGHNVAAERIFLRLFDPMRDLNDLSPSIRIRVLDNMGSYYEKAKNQPQLQRISKILLALPFSTRKDLKIKAKAQQRMAQSMLDTASVISSAFADRFGSNIGPPVHCPALHQGLLFGDREVFGIILKKVRERTVPRSGRLLFPSGSDNLGVMSGPTEGLDIPDTLGRTALFLAVVRKAEDICDDLISAGAMIKTRDCNGHTLLEIAAENGLFETVKRMLSRAKELGQELGQDFLRGFVNDVLWYNTSTPLQAAAAGGRSEIVRLLLSNGACKDVKRLSDDKTAAELAADNKHDAIAAEIENWHYENAQDFERIPGFGRVPVGEIPPPGDRPPDPSPSRSNYFGPSAASDAPGTGYSMGGDYTELLGSFDGPRILYPFQVHGNG